MPQQQKKNHFLPPTISHSYRLEMLMSGLFTVAVLGALGYHLVDFNGYLVELFLAMMFYSLIIPLVGYFISVDVKTLWHGIKGLFSSKNEGTTKAELQNHLPDDLHASSTSRHDDDDDEHALLKRDPWVRALSFLYQRACLWFQGFVVVIGFAFMLGFFLHGLTVLNFLVFLLVINGFHVGVQASAYMFRVHHRMKGPASESTVEDDTCKEEDQMTALTGLRTKHVFMEREMTIKIVLLTVIIAGSVLIARLPVLRLPYQVMGVDTWANSALAMQVVLTGDIKFIQGILGIFEFLPTEEAPVTPLSIAVGAIFSSTNVLTFQYHVVVFFTVIGFIALFRFFLQVLDQFFVFNEKVPRFWLAYLATVLFFTVPIVVSYTDGFLSGRSIFLVFFPFLLTRTFDWFHDHISSFRHAFFLCYSSIFLMAAHRMVAIIFLPLVSILVAFKIIDKRKRSPTNIVNDQAPRGKPPQHLLVMLLVMNPLIFFGMIILNVIRTVLTGNALPPPTSHYLDYHVPSSLIHFFSEELNPWPFTDSILLMMGLTIGMGVLLFLFILEMVFAPLIVSRARDVMSRDALRFYLASKLAIIPSFAFFWIAPYFYQSMLHVITYQVIMGASISACIVFGGISTTSSPENSVTSNGKNHLSMNIVARPPIHARKNDDLYQRIKRKIFRNPAKTARIMFLVLILLLFIQPLTSETYRVVRELNASEPSVRYMNEEMIEIARIIENFGMTTSSQNQTLTVLTPLFGLLSLKLSVLLPHVKFIPNTPPMLAAYHQVHLEYELNFNWQDITSLERLYHFLRVPFDASPYYQFLSKLRQLYTKNITFPETQQQLRELGVNMAIIMKNTSEIFSNNQTYYEEKMGVLLLSIIQQQEPIASTEHYWIFALPSFDRTHAVDD